MINNSELDEKTQVKIPAAQVSCAAGLAAYVYPFKVKLHSDTVPSLHLTYLRLQSFRRYPEVASFSTYRTQTYLGPTTQAQNFALTAGLDIFDSGKPKFIPCNPVNNFFSKGVSQADVGIHSGYYKNAYRPDLNLDTTNGRTCSLPNRPATF